MTSTDCTLCALDRGSEDVLGLGWSTQHATDGGVTWICPACTRAQLWLIEVGLPIATAYAPARAA